MLVIDAAQQQDTTQQARRLEKWTELLALMMMRQGRRGSD